MRCIAANILPVPSPKVLIEDRWIVVNDHKWRVPCFEVLTQRRAHSSETANDEMILQQPNVFFHFSSLQQSLQVRVHQDLTKLNSSIGDDTYATNQVAHDENLGAISQRRRLSTSDSRQQNNALVEAIEKPLTGKNVQTDTTNQQQCHNQHRYLQQSSHVSSLMILPNQSVARPPPGRPFIHRRMATPAGEKCRGRLLE